MILPSGQRIERLPAWIKRVTQDISVSSVYEARLWNPPEEERYTFKHHRPHKPNGIRIYEAHVGISTSEPRVGTYKEFTKEILPRIQNLGYNAIQLMAIMEHAYYACRLLNSQCQVITHSSLKPSDTKSLISLPPVRGTVPPKN